MKRLFTLIAAGALLLTMALPASAQAVTDVVEDVDKHIAAGATVGSQTFTISATFTPAGPGAQMGEGIGFYYQNGDGTPPQSFYRVVLWRDNGSDAGADRLDFYCEKQYNDKHVGNVPASINGVAADDPDINEEFRYISTDWGWYAAADAAYKMDVTVDPGKKQATAVLTGIPSGNRAVLVVDLTQKALGEKKAGELTSGEVFVWKTKCSYSNFQLDGADNMSTVPPSATSVVLDNTTASAGTDSTQSQTGESNPGGLPPMVEAPSTHAAPANPKDVAVGGVLKDVDGNLLPNKLLIVDQSSGKQTNTITDEKGVFTFPKLPEGMTTISVRDENGNVQAAKRFQLRAGTAAAVSEDGSRVTAGENGGVGLTLVMNLKTYGIELFLNTEVELPTTTAKRDTSPEGECSFPVLWIVLGGAVLVVAAGAAVTVVLWKKKRPSPSAPLDGKEKGGKDKPHTP